MANANQARAAFWMQAVIAALVVFAIAIVLFLLMGQALLGMLVGAGVAVMRFLLAMLPLG